MDNKILEILEQINESDVTELLKGLNCPDALKQYRQHKQVKHVLDLFRKGLPRDLVFKRLRNEFPYLSKRTAYRRIKEALCHRSG